MRKVALLSIVLLALAGCAAPRAAAPPQPAAPTEPAAPTLTPTPTPTPAVQALAQRPPLKASAPPALYPAYVGESKRWGYIGPDGQWVITARFDEAREFAADGVAVVKSGGHYALINAHGDFVLAPKYDEISELLPDRVRIARSGPVSDVTGDQGELLFTASGLTGRFSSGLAPFSRAELYGYIDLAGRVVIEPQYRSAGDFADGQALVQLEPGRYAVIDSSGQRLALLEHDFVTGLREGVASFRDKPGEQQGYLSADGQVLLAPQFARAEPFRDGYAVVGVGKDDWSARIGLIDRQGRFAIAPAYSSIQPLGAGLYAVGELTKEHRPEPFTRKAIFDQSGRRLTDFIYYDVGEVEAGRICVTDFTSTFFLDTAGARAADLPVIAGIGTLRLRGDLIRADIDGTLSYLTRSGQTIWQADRTQDLGGGLRVLERKVRPDRSLLIYYPELSGLPNPQVQATINSRLHDLFLGPGAFKLGGGDFHATTDTHYTVERRQNLLLVRRTSYTYPIGAAHGMPEDDTYHLDLRTGALYSLADLFQAGSPYRERLQQLVAQQIAAGQGPTGKGQYLNTKNPPVKADQPFRIGPDGLIIYWYPYEIAAYAAGFPSFTLPFDSLTDLLNTDGAFWRAFH